VETCRHADAAELLAACGPWLLQSEAENNLILGIAQQHCGTDANTSDGGQYWASVRHDGATVGCAFRTPPHPISLTQMPSDGISALIHDVAEVYDTLPGVGGPAEPARSFAEIWAQRHRLEWRVRFHLRIHRLERVRYPKSAPGGKLRQPKSSELPLVQRWTVGFVDDTGIVHRPEEFADLLAQSGQLYFWDDNGPRCMVAAARATPNGTTINAVYTPPADRGRGYASIAVATLSQQLLADGKKFCCLYTDLANRTSNSIYRRLGYQPVSDAVEIEFIDTE
jgi:ribosomal protein S18 acetylase RimI-like enzyme